MEIKVVSNIPNARATAVNCDDGSILVIITEATGCLLSSVLPGAHVKIGEREYIVLEQNDDKTFLYDVNPIRMEFGEDNNFGTSKVRDYCNTDYYAEVCRAVGSENIISHTVNLEADDGTGKNISCECNVSILTTELYRKYRDYIPSPGYPMWLATPVTHTVDGYAHSVCCVYSDGVLSWNYCNCSSDVRPFLVLKSSILVDVITNER